MDTESLQDKAMEIAIELPTQAYFLSGIRDFILNLTKNVTGFSQQWAFRFQAVVDEMCNNAIEHGSAAGQNIKVQIVSQRGKHLEVIVSDTGTGPEKMNAKQMTELYKERRQVTQGEYLGFRGRGLPKIVGEWTDEVMFEDNESGGITVRVKKYLRSEEDEVLSKQSKASNLVLS